ncbi:MAG: PA domain-containing protein [Pirellulaceae bacterium]
MGGDRRSGWAETELVAGTDYQPQMLGGPGPIEAEMVFAGYGITSAEFEYDDYEGLDCQGKFVVVIRREPQQNDADSPFDGLETSAYATIRNKLATASLHGVAGIILVNDQPSTQTAGGDFLATPELELPPMAFPSSTCRRPRLARSSPPIRCKRAMAPSSRPWPKSKPRSTPTFKPSTAPRWHEDPLPDGG